MSAAATLLKSKLMAFVELFEEAARDDKMCLCGVHAAEVSALDDANRSLLRAFFTYAEALLVGALEQHEKDVAGPLSP